MRPDLLPGYAKVAAQDAKNACLKAPKPPKLNGVPLHECIDDATQVFSAFTYFRGSGTEALCLLLILASRAFFISFPFVVGVYVRDARRYYDGELGSSDFEAARNRLFISLGIAGVITAICEQAHVVINGKGAEQMKMNVLYAVPYSYN